LIRPGRSEMGGRERFSRPPVTGAVRVDLARRC
jgi:hypothetical protein